MTGQIVAIFTLLITLAVVAVLVSQKAQTAAVIDSITKGTSGVIGAAVSPITGGGSGG